MKLKTRITKLGIVAIASLALTVGVAAAAASSIKPIEAGAYYTPSTHYEVSNTASKLASYYSTIYDTDSGTSLLSKLQSLNSTKRKKTVGYDTIGTDTNDAAIYTDYDLNSTRTDSNGQTYGTKVASFYTKTASTSWNREHVWPNSHGGDKVEADILHTRPTISSENSSRGNSFYVEGKNSSSAGWDPYTAGYDAAVRGECARIILYSVVAYSGFSLSDQDSHSTSNANPDYMMGNMHTLIKWHYQYSPNVYEINRNNGAEYLQGNRNPFVDHPEYVARIWGDYDSTVSTLVNQNESMYDGWIAGNSSTYGQNNATTSSDKVSLNKYSETIAKDATTTITATSSSGSNISWATSDSSVVTISSSSSNSGSSITLTGVATGTARITATATINGQTKSKTCTITVSTSGGSSGGGQSGGDSSGKVTSISNISSGTTYRIGATVSNTDYYFVASGGTSVGTGLSGTGTTTASQATPVTFTGSGSSWTLKLANNNYLSLSSTKSNGNYVVSSSANTWTASNSGSLINLTINGYSLQRNSSAGTNKFGSYSGQTDVWLEPVSSGTTKTLSSIAVKTAPTKTTYTAGEYFAPAGLKITLTYSDSTTEDVTYSNSNSSLFTFSPSTSTALTVSNTSVTISYGGKSTSQAITVNAAQVTTYTVTYNANGATSGSVPTDSNAYASGASVTVKGNTDGLAKTNYTFAGWTTNSNGTGTVYAANSSYTITSNTIFYAKWNEDSGSSSSTTEGTYTIGWGTATGTTGTYTNFTETSGSVSGLLSFESAKNNSSNEPAYNASSSELRLYYNSQGKGGSITITPAEGVTFTQAVVTSSTTPNVSYSVDGGSATSASQSAGVYTISNISCSSSLTIQNVNTGNTQLRIKTIALTYTSSGSSGSSGSGSGSSGTSIYSLVTGSLSAGDKVFIAAKNSSNEYYILGSTVIAQYYLTSTLGTVSDNKLSNTTSDMTLWTVEKTNSTYSFKDGSNYLYSYTSVNTNNNKTYYNPGVSSTATTGKTWTYSNNQLQSDLNIYLTHKLYTNKDNSITPEFAGLDSEPSDYTIYFFRETTQYTADEFSQIFVDSITCDSTGNTAPVLTKSWSDLKDVYNAISSTAEKNKLLYADFTVDGETVTPASGTTQVVANAMSKYDILISKYASTYTDNFIGRPASAQQNLFITQSESSTTMMIVIVSIISISAISGFVFLKKRKEN